MSELGVPKRSTAQHSTASHAGAWHQLPAHHTTVPRSIELVTCCLCHASSSPRHPSTFPFQLPHTTAPPLSLLVSCHTSLYPTPAACCASSLPPRALSLSLVHLKLVGHMSAAAGCMQVVYRIQSSRLVSGGKCAVQRRAHRSREMRESPQQSK